jgi:hypothetical protein
MARVKSYIAPTSFGNTMISDKNNCTVRALSNVTGKDVRDCYLEMKKLGRKDNKGCYPKNFHVCYVAQNNLKFLGYYGTTLAAERFKRDVESVGYNLAGMRQNGTSLEKFIKDHPVGKYIVITIGHAVAVVDGKLIDTGLNRGGVSVLAAYKA